MLKYLNSYTNLYTDEELTEEQVSYAKSLQNKMKSGFLGLNKGIPTHLFNSPLNKIIPGNYYLIAGETGSGKSSLTDQLFVNSILNLDTTETLEQDNVIIYFSLEVSKIRKIAKLISYLNYYDNNLAYGVEDILSEKEIIDEQILEQISNVTEKYEKALENRLLIFEHIRNVEEIIDFIQDFTEEIGEFKKISVVNKTTGEVFEDTIFKRKDSVEDIPLTITVVLDHVGLITSNRDMPLRERIVTFSSYCVQHRNKYRSIFAVIQQMNEKNMTIDRIKNHNINKVAPAIGDLRESSDTGKDANIQILLFSPFRYAISEYDNYEADSLGDRFRVVTIPKARDGAIGNLYLHYYGEVGMFQMLPTPEEINDIKLKKNIILYHDLVDPNKISNTTKNLIKRNKSLQK